MVRESLKLEFLHNCNLKDAQRVKLKNDASFRRYERIIDNDKSFILMDAPIEHEETLPFINIANFLKNSNLSAPEILNSNSEHGFILLEDFGDESFNNILSGKSPLSNELGEDKIYERAVDCLIHLHKIPSTKISIPEYTDEIYLRESNQFIDWYVSTLNGEILSEDQKQEFNYILKELLDKTKISPDVVVLRDYHADNLMWLTDRVAHNKVGILDFQDALMGSITYDLVSLLEDARRDVNTALAENMINHYLKAFPQLSRKDFHLAYTILGIQRNLKIVGFCARQAVHNKNPFYLSLLPRVWRYINNDLKHPSLLHLKKWLVKAVPSQIRE